MESRNGSLGIGINESSAPRERNFTFDISHKKSGWTGSHTVQAINLKEATHKAQINAGSDYTVHGYGKDWNLAE